MKFSRRFAVDGETPGHAEMHDQSFARRQFCHQEFRPTPHAFNPGAFDSRAKPVRKREPQIGSIYLETLNDPALHSRRQATANGFNFGQFRHLDEVGGFLSCGKRRR